MTPADKPRFAAVLNGLASVKPGQTARLTPEALDVWWLALGEWPLAEFEQAAGLLLRSTEFMPNPYHFEQLRKAGEETAGEAWARALTYVRAGCRGDSPGGKVDRIVHAMGGWSVIGGDASGTPFREKRFAELWGEIGEADEVRQALPSVARLSGPQRAVPKIARQA